VSELFLKSLRFKDFRTFGEFAAEIVPAPGLTLLVGTNGLGKSSFFDALEWGLTGEVRRFKSYMGPANQGRYLTRRGAPMGSHEVCLEFSDASVLSRGPAMQPDIAEVITLLKKAVWTAQIQDIGTYLAFTHFLGQAAEQRFTSRARGEQWESLKGPSGIERLDEVRQGLRGRATEMAFNRRIRRETEAVAEAERQLAEWQRWRPRLGRLREAAEAAGALPAEAFASRLQVLVAAVARLGSNFEDDAAASPGERLAAVRVELEELRQEAVSRRAMLEAVADLPQRYAAQTAAADSEAQPLVDARAAAEGEAEALAAAVAVTVSARERLDTAAGTVAARDAEVAGLESVRANLDTAARVEADLTRLQAERQRLDAELGRRRAEIQKLEDELSDIQTRSATIVGLAAAAQAAAGLAEQARRLPELREQAAAGATAQAEAKRDAEIARERLTGLTSERNRLESELEGVRAALEAARDRASAVAAAVAEIASHLHDDDLDCPVCKTRFEPGGLRLVAKEAAKAQSAALTDAEAQHAALLAQLGDTIQRIAVADAVLRNAEAARAQVAADAAAAAELEAWLRAVLPGAGDLVSAALEAERRAAEALATARVAAAADQARRAEAAALRDNLRADLSPLEQQVAGLRDELVGRAAERRSALERLAAAGLVDATAARLDLRLANARKARVEAEAARLNAREELRQPT
jgi:DNA repair exonuclease SbcCD ATPase subunit